MSNFSYEIISLNLVFNLTLVHKMDLGTQISKNKITFINQVVLVDLLP